MKYETPQFEFHLSPVQRSGQAQHYKILATGLASIHKHFNLERHLIPRETYKQNRSAALAEWRQLAA